jgi:NAD(P)H dehydrogenase (quinone)
MDVAVTGSTGGVGGRVAATLADRGVAQRLLVRDPSRAPQLPNTEVVKAAYGSDAADALAGVKTLFMVSAGEAADRVDQHRAFVDAAVAAGVEHLVYTSFVGACPDATFTLVRDHSATEEHIRASGLTYTILRDNLYADFVPAMAGADGIIRGPAGDGRAAVVARHDVAAVAAEVMRDPLAHVGAVYELTGPQALTFTEMAAVVSDVTGRQVRYHDETLDEAYASRAHYGAPDWMVEAWVSTYLAVASGEMAQVSDDVPRLLGRPATAFIDVVRAVT